MCGHSLQLRERKFMELLRGEEIEKTEEYICCSVCDYEEEIRNPKKRKVVFDKTKFVKEPEEKRRYSKSNASDKKRTGFKKDFRKGSK